MKKSVIIAGVIALTIFSISLVAAALPSPPITMDYLKNFFTSLLSGNSLDDTTIKVLLVLLLTTVLFRPAYQITGQKSGIAFIIAFLVSVLGVKYLAAYTLIKGVLLPYGALAIALSAGLPFLLIGGLLITSQMGDMLRKFMWGLMAGAFIMLWWWRWTDLGELAWIYLGVGCIALAILLFFDDTLQNMYTMSTIGSAKASRTVEIVNLNTKIANLYTSIAAATPAQQTIIRRQIRHLEAARNALVRMRP